MTSGCEAIRQYRFNFGAVHPQTSIQQGYAAAERVADPGDRLTHGVAATSSTRMVSAWPKACTLQFIDKDVGFDLREK
jgi:hypothetical protein